jgi:tRNA (guanine37-N1)-methyltransferase
MKFQIISLFPSIIESYLSQGIMTQALKKNLFEYQILNPRDQTQDTHRSVDDRPFGGGDGMVMLPEVLEATLLKRPFKNDHIVYLSPQGTRLNEKKVQDLKTHSEMTFICGRYGGIDQRIINEYVHEEISIGDYVLSGGELAALVIMDALVRKIPGSLGHVDSAEKDSFAGSGLEHPLFTRPQDWKGQKVPKVLLSGNHALIENWKQKVSKLVTLKKRPDLLDISSQERNLLLQFLESMTVEEKEICGLGDIK